MDDTKNHDAIGGGDIMRMTTDIVASYVSNNTIPSEAVGEVLRNVHKTVAGLASGATERAAEKQKPAVPVSKSITPDFLICLEDGKKLKMLKRYLRSNYGLSPDDYRRKWGLPADYPMVAPNYSEKRSQYAKDLGLGKRVRR